MHLFCLLHFTFLLHPNQQSSQFLQPFQDCKQGNHVITWKQRKIGLTCTFNRHFGPLALGPVKIGPPGPGMSLSWSKLSWDKKVQKDLVLIGPSGGSLEKLSYIFFTYEVLCIDKVFFFCLAFRKEKCSTWIRKSQHHNWWKKKKSETAWILILKWEICLDCSSHKKGQEMFWNVLKESWCCGWDYLRIVCNFSILSLTEAVETVAFLALVWCWQD